MHYDGVYINLSISRVRRERLESQLATLGVADRYHRFEAIRGDEAQEQAETTLPAGQVGCWLSHLAVWRQAEGAGTHLHVLEDDASLSPLLFQVLEELPLDDSSWDLLVTDAYFHPPPSPEQFARLHSARQAFLDKRQVTLIDLRRLSFTGLTSYLVNRGSLKRLGELLHGGWRSNRTIDVVLQDLVRKGAVRARLIFPFLSTLAQEHEQSTAGLRGPAIKSLDALRLACFYEADPDAIRRRAIDCRCYPQTDPLLELYLNCLRGVLGTMR